MNLFALALLALTTAQAAPIAYDAPVPECYGAAPAAHFCGCGIENYSSYTLARVDLVGNQRFVTRLQNYGSDQSCQAALLNNSHPACR